MRETSVQDIIALAREFCPRRRHKHRPGRVLLKNRDGDTTVELKRIASGADWALYTVGPFNERHD
jgi:hypothetical protein